MKDFDNNNNINDEDIDILNEENENIEDNEHNSDSPENEKKPLKQAMQNAKDKKQKNNDITLEEALKLKLAKAEKLSEEYLDKLKRTLAEFDNFRKRTNQEKDSMFENGAIFAIEKLLPILDNFERAIGSIKEEDKESAVYKGVVMIYKQMQDAFTSIGISEIEGEGSAFNPNIHNAVMHIDDDTLEENVVAEVLQKGYKYKEKVIRPSMVKVAN